MNFGGRPQKPAFWRMKSPDRGFAFAILRHNSRQSNNRMIEKLPLYGMFSVRLNTCCCAHHWKQWMDLILNDTVLGKALPCLASRLQPMKRRACSFVFVPGGTRGSGDRWRALLTTYVLYPSRRKLRSPCVASWLVSCALLCSWAVVAIVAEVYYVCMYICMG